MPFDASDEEELDGGVVPQAAGGVVQQAAAKNDDDDDEEEEELDGGTVVAPMPVKGEEEEEEEELDGGVVAAPPAAIDDDDDEEELDGGVVTAPPAAIDDDDEEEELDGGVVAADLFGPDNIAYESTTVLSAWLPPARKKDGKVTCARRRAPKSIVKAPVAKKPKVEHKVEPADQKAAASSSFVAAAKAFEPPSFEPPSFEPPSFEPPSFAGATSSFAAATSSFAAAASSFTASCCAPAADTSAAEASTGGTSIGERMMRNMGHKKGTGLGKKEQGLTATIDTGANMNRTGLGFESQDGGGWNMKQAVAAPLGPEELDPCPKAVWMGACATGPPDAATLRAWLVEGPRVESIDNETEHCEPAVLKAMLERKSALDIIPQEDRRAFNDARTRANPFEGLRKEFFLNRAALKMAAMDAAFGLLLSGADAEHAEGGLPAFSEAALGAAVAAFQDATMAGSSTSAVARPAPSVLYFGDVAAGPGGFSEYMLWRRGGAGKGFGFTLRDSVGGSGHDFELHKFHHRAAPELFHPYYGPNDDGDLYESDNIRALAGLVRRQTGGEMLHVMMADGGFDVSGMENIQEVMNKQLLLSQCVAALATLRVGGHFVCKCFDLFTPFSAGLLYLLHTAFDAVCLYKPAQSRPANSERYIVCRGMRAGVEALVEHLLEVNTRLNVLKPDWPTGGRKGAAGRGTGDGGYGNLDVLRLVPREMLQDPHAPFGEYLEESNNRLGALQARALERLIAYMREKGSRICDHAATRDDCLIAWMLPPEVPPPPPSHPNIESFFVYEVERGDPLPRHFMADHQNCALSSNDLTVQGGMSRLRTTSDWVLVESATDSPPILVLGADGDGLRGVACAFEPLANTWRPISGVRIPAATLLLAEMVYERVRGVEAPVECVHVLDAAMICGDDIRRYPYVERRRRIALLVDALACDPAVDAQRELSPAEMMPVDPYAVGPQEPRRIGGAPKGHDGVRVRLKPEYRLHQIASAVQAGSERQEASEAVEAVDDAPQVGWPFRGLVFFPGHASPLLPLEPPHEWKKEWSKSQQKEYYFNARTGQSVWAEHRKSRPISFRSCSAAMLRWSAARLGTRGEHPGASPSSPAPTPQR